MEGEWTCLDCLELYRNLVDQCMLCPECHVFCVSSHSVLCTLGSPRISEFCNLFRGSSWRLYYWGDEDVGGM